MFKTEFEFILPKGFLDKNGVLHRKGVMRLATAKDEIAPLQDHRVRNNQSYMVLIILSRVITSLGDVHLVDVKLIEKLFSADLEYLQSLYQKINTSETTDINLLCPHCNENFTKPLDEVLPSGE